MTHMIRLKLLKTLVFAAFLCCCISPSLTSPAWAQVQEATGGMALDNGSGGVTIGAGGGAGTAGTGSSGANSPGAIPETTVMGDPVFEIVVEGSATADAPEPVPFRMSTSGKLSMGGGCIFDTAPELYEQWGNGTSIFAEYTYTDSLSSYQAEGLSVPSVKAAREKLDITGKPTEWGCPVISLNDGPARPLSACKDFYNKVATLDAARPEVLKTTGSVYDSGDIKAETACCHVPYEYRLACIRGKLTGSERRRVMAIMAGANLGVKVKGMSVEQVQAMKEAQEKEYSAAMQCLDKNFERVQNFYKNKKIARCIKTVKSMFKKKVKEEVSDITDKGVDRVMDAGGDINTPTAGTSVSAGNTPSRVIQATAEAPKAGARIAKFAARTADYIDKALNGCLGIATQFTQFESLFKNLGNRICEATVGLVARQLTQCIRFNFSGALGSLPQFNFLTQCPINMNVNLRWTSQGGFACSSFVSGQSPIPGVVNAAPSADFIANTFGGLNCAGSRRVTNGTGGFVTVRSDGTVENPPELLRPRLAGVDCGDSLDPATENLSALAGINFLPPGPAPTSGTGWVVGPVSDTGFAENLVTPFAEEVSRCDYYVDGRIRRTAYVYGDGAACLATNENAFKVNGHETLTSCYPGGYIPVEQSAIPEACLYPQAAWVDGQVPAEQPCLFNDLSGLDPAKVTAFPPQQSSDAATSTLTSIPVSVGNKGNLSVLLSPTTVNTITSSGQTATVGPMLSPEPISNFTAALSAPELALSPEGLVALSVAGNGGINGTNVLGTSTPLAALSMLQPGDIVDLAVNQFPENGCVRGFATHDSLNGELIERRYPLPRTGAGGMNTTGPAVQTGSCTAFSLSAEFQNMACCDPQVQDCRKPDKVELPICACDQGDSTVRAIPDRDANGNVITEPALGYTTDANGQKVGVADASGQIPTRPVYVCVDKDNKRLEGAKLTCCNATLNGEGPEGCGSPYGVSASGPIDILQQSIKGAVQIRASNQDKGFDFGPNEGEGEVTTYPELPRCIGAEGMCLPKSDALQAVKPSPYNFLIVRPDSQRTALNGKVVQCCTSKWCNVCPQAYAGAYGLTKLSDPGFNYAEAYVNGAAGWDMEVNPSEGHGGIARPGTSDPFTDKITLSQKEGGPAQLQIERDWHSQLFRDGWPWVENTGNDNSSSQFRAGRGAWLGILFDQSNVEGLDNGHWRKPWALFGYNNGKNDFRRSASGFSHPDVRCGSAGDPCLFPNFTISNSLPAVPAQMNLECEADASQTSGWYVNSWERFKKNVRNTTYDNSSMSNYFILGVDSIAISNFMGLNCNGDCSQTGDFAIGAWSEANYEFKIMGVPHSNPTSMVYMPNMWWLFRSWQDSYGYAYIGDNPARDEDGKPLRNTIFGVRPLLIETKPLMGEAMGMRLNGEVYGAVPEPDIYPIDYLNELKAKLTPPDMEFEPIKLCDQALPVCTSPALQQYGDGGVNNDNNNSALGMDGSNDFGSNMAGDNGNGQDGNGSGLGPDGIPLECAGLTGDALQACINNYYMNLGSFQMPPACAAITDPVALAACLATYGIGDGTIPAPCVGLTGVALGQCIWDYFGLGNGGGMGQGGLPQGGLNNTGLGPVTVGGSTTPTSTFATGGGLPTSGGGGSGATGAATQGNTGNAMSGTNNNGTVVTLPGGGNTQSSTPTNTGTPNNGTLQSGGSVSVTGPGANEGLF